jgi:hypothetical protein
MKGLRIFLMALVCAASWASLDAMARQTVPVINYENLPLTTASGRAPTAAQVKQAIQSAAGARQWTLVDQGPGRMLATLQVRGKHTVVTQISYSADKLSVTYSDSTNMNYAPGPDGKGAIHPFYNRWVQDLTDAIRLTLAKI